MRATIDIRRAVSEKRAMQTLIRIVVLLFVIPSGALVAGYCTRLLVGSDPDKHGADYALLVILTVLLVATRLYMRSWRKTGVKAAPPVPSGSSKTVRSGFVWALVIVIGGPLLYQSVRTSQQNRARKLQPGYAAFESANLLLMSKSRGIAHGNVPEAQLLAEKFSERLKLVRQLGIESGKSSFGSLTGGEFLTYCLLAGDTCVFMVHVPDLRKFSSEAKSYLVSAAWATALTITESSQPGLRNICVGVRGALMYDRLIAGSAGSPENANALRFTEIAGDPECQEYLQSMFATPFPASADATLAPSKLE